MKTLHIKIILVSLLVFSTLLLVLAVGLMPWLRLGLARNTIEQTKAAMRIAAPTFELGTLVGDSHFLHEPMDQLIQQTSAEYVVIYTSEGTRISVRPETKSKELSPLPAELLKRVMKDEPRLAMASFGATDLYMPIWSRTPLDPSLMDEVKIFFPHHNRLEKEDPSGARFELLGILRLGRTETPDLALPFPAGKARTYLILSLLVGALVLLLAFWWALYKRLEPIEQGVNELFNGNYSHRIPPQSASELSALAEGINIIAAKLDTLAADASGSGADEPNSAKLDRMADELAHPAGSLFMNLDKLLEYITGLLKVLNAYSQIKLDTKTAQELEELKENTEYDHVIEDVERLLRSCINSIDKIKRASKELKALASSGPPRSVDPS